MKTVDRQCELHQLWTVMLACGVSVGCAGPADEVRSHLKDWQELGVKTYTFVHSGGGQASNYNLLGPMGYRVEVHDGVTQSIATGIGTGLPTKALVPEGIGDLRLRLRA